MLKACEKLLIRVNACQRRAKNCEIRVNARRRRAKNSELRVENWYKKTCVRVKKWYVLKNIYLCFIPDESLITDFVKSGVKT